MPSSQSMEPTGHTYLDVDYKDRLTARATGAYWDKEKKSWYIGPQATEEQKAFLLNVFGSRELSNNQDSSLSPRDAPRDAFAQVLQEEGCILSPPHPVMDGEKHRIATEGDKPGSLSGFYIGHLDGLPAGNVTNHRTGVSRNWRYEGHIPQSREKKLQNQAEILTRQAEKEACTAKLQEGAVQAVKDMMRNKFRPARPDERLPYLAKKGIEARAGVFVNDALKMLMIPAVIFDSQGNQQITTAQFIREDGTKLFKANGKKTGCFHQIGGNPEELHRARCFVITEGYATGVSIQRATDQPVIVAFDAHNMRAVAESFRKQFPGKGLVIAADDDIHLETHLRVRKNIGWETAQAVADELGGTAVRPVFAPGEQSSDPKKFTDFNDLEHYSKFGGEGVKKQIDAAIAREKARLAQVDSDLTNIAKKEQCQRHRKR